MRENVRDRDRLEHISEAISNILEFADGITKEELEADKLRFYGVVKNIEIIGEAAYKLTRAFCREHSETPWEFIAKMRHVLVHDYYQIDPDQVWSVIKDDLRPLQKQVTSYLAETDWEAWERNEVAINETAVHKSLTQTARRMLSKGYSVREIIEITGLPADEIEAL